MPLRLLALTAAVGIGLGLGGCRGPAAGVQAGDDPSTGTGVAIRSMITIDDIGIAYRRLALALGEHGPNEIDAYYGAAAVRDAVREEKPTLAQIEREARALQAQLPNAGPGRPADAMLLRLRRRYLEGQLGALLTRARMLQGQRYTFDEESLALYGTQAPQYEEADFARPLARIAELLPAATEAEAGATLAQRYNRYVDALAVPPERLAEVMQQALDEARRRAAAKLPLPDGEEATLGFVSGKPWSAYNWYQGGLRSRIEINTELPIPVSRVIELAVHEGYPGHHVYNALLEDRLVRAQGWPEFTVYALFSPQSLIAEGTADYGIGLAFPGRERQAFTETLFTAAGLDPAEAARYLAIIDAANALKPAGIEAARRYLDGRASADATRAFLERNLLYSPERAAQRLRFIETYRAYIINYSWGEELVRAHVQREAGPAPAGSPAQWRAFLELLTTPRTAATLELAGLLAP